MRQSAPKNDVTYLLDLAPHKKVSELLKLLKNRLEAQAVLTSFHVFHFKRVNVRQLIYPYH